MNIPPLACLIAAVTAFMGRGVPSEGASCESLASLTMRNVRIDQAQGRTLRSLPVFRRWFDCQFHSMVLDLTDEPLIQEEI